MNRGNHIVTIALEVKSHGPITQEWLNKLRNDIDLNNDYTELAKCDVTCVDWKKVPAATLH